MIDIAALVSDRSHYSLFTDLEFNLKHDYGFIYIYWCFMAEMHIVPDVIWQQLSSIPYKTVVDGTTNA